MKKLAAMILLLLLINCAEAQKLEWTNPDGLGKNPAYSQMVRAGKLLFIAGQTGVTADGKVVGPGMKQQYEQALNRKRWPSALTVKPVRRPRLAGNSASGVANVKVSGSTSAAAMICRSADMKNNSLPSRFPCA